MGLYGNFTKYPGPWISVAQTSLDFTCMEWSLLIYRFSQAIKSELTFFFPRMSQGHNTLTRPGLEPGLSNSEPSALTTGLLYKAVALTCPRYSWPCMLKVTPCTVVQSYSCTVLQLYSHTSKFFRLDGLLLFFIIMGLHSASSAIISVYFARPWMGKQKREE